MAEVSTHSPFDGAVVLITGAGRGIGRATAHRFAHDGARVALLDRDRDSCDTVVREISEQGGKACAIVADLGDPSARAKVVEQVVAWSGGRLDILVNNAALHGPRLPLEQLSDADVRDVLEVDLIAPLLLSRDALQYLARARGSIVMVSSIQAELPLATFASYVASKGALNAVTRALAVEVAPRGVRVNAVAPGAVESPSMREQWKETGNQNPPTAPTLVGRWGSDEDIAGVITFLCSPAAAFICGEVIRADGGRLLSRDPDPLNAQR